MQLQTFLLSVSDHCSCPPSLPSPPPHRIAIAWEFHSVLACLPEKKSDFLLLINFQLQSSYTETSVEVRMWTICRCCMRPILCFIRPSNGEISFSAFSCKRNRTRMYAWVVNNCAKAEYGKDGNLAAPIWFTASLYLFARLGRLSAIASIAVKCPQLYFDTVYISFYFWLSISCLQVATSFNLCITFTVRLDGKK